MTPVAVGLVVALAVIAGGCRSAEQPRGVVPVKPGCEGIAPAKPASPVAGLLLPRARVVPAPVPRSRGDGQITFASGYVEVSPDHLLRAFERRPGIRVLLSESEGFEAEVLVSDGRHRNFWKVLRRCNGGSSFSATIAPESVTGG